MRQPPAASTAGVGGRGGYLTSLAAFSAAAALPCIPAATAAASTTSSDLTFAACSWAAVGSALALARAAASLAAWSACC